MSFFYNETKAAPKPKAAAKRGVIPIASLQQLGCSVCTHDSNRDLLSPKMRPSGTDKPSIYLLGSAPSKEEDEDNNHWTDAAGEAIYKAFGSGFMRNEVRSNFITQCRGDQTEVEIACCRPRIVADIEATKPAFIVTIGDAPFQWATGMSSGAMPHRGSTFVARIGNHTCRVMPILYPNFVHKKKYGKSEYELTLEHDVAAIKKAVDDGWLPAVVHTKPFDKGIEIITGQEPNDLQRLEQALNKLLAEDAGVDIETNGLRPHFLKEPKVWMAAVGNFDHTVAFPLDHPDGWGTEGRRRQVWALFGRYLLESRRKAVHNLAMELEWFHYFFGPKLMRETEWDDTMAMAHTLDERPGTKSLDVQTRMHFGFSVKSLSNIDVKRILEYPIKDTLRYNALDNKWTCALRTVLRPLVKAENQAEYDRKVRLAPTLVIMEAKGLPADLIYARKLDDKLADELEVIEKKLAKDEDVREYRQRFGVFSPTNPDHVLKLLKDVCRRPEIAVEDKRTKAIRYTTDEEALASIPAKEVPAVPLVLEHRSASKLRGTYIQPVLRREIICPDNRMRSKYSSMVAVTGRLASEDPNQQNWPKRKHREVRGIIAAAKGQAFLALDYGQIEFRVVGMASEDPNLVRACWTGYDVHKFWAERMVALFPEIKDYIVEAFQVDWDEKGLKTLRQEAKNGWVFPQLFGSSIRSCAEQLHIPLDVAEDLAGEFWDEFRQVKKWQEKLLAGYNRNLYVETLGGRKRRGPMTPNMVINMPIQGTAADIVTEAMCALSEKAEAEDNPDLDPSMNVHDDLTYMMGEDRIPELMPVIAREMCKPRFDYINVPLVVEASVGYRWHELEEVKVYKSHELFNTPNPYA